MQMQIYKNLTDNANRLRLWKKIDLILCLVVPGVFKEQLSLLNKLTIVRALGLDASYWYTRALGTYVKTPPVVVQVSPSYISCSEDTEIVILVTFGYVRL